MRNKLKLTILVIIVLSVGLPFTIGFADESWKIESEIDEWDRIHKIAVIENSLGFKFAITGKTTKGVLYIPFKYPALSKRGQYFKLQIDRHPIKKLIYVTMERNQRAAFFYPRDQLITQLKEGNMLKISYYGTSGWTGAISFSLKGSSNAITEAIR